MANVKSNSVISVETLGDRITFNVIGAGSLTLDLNSLSKEVLSRAALHGMKQRISDAAAIPRSLETGLSATPEEKFNAMKALVEHYSSGSSDWNRARAAGGGVGKDTSGQTIAAMKRVWPDKDPETLIAATMSKRGIERKAALALYAGTKQVLEAIALLKAERSSVSADSLLDDMSAE